MSVARRPQFVPALLIFATALASRLAAIGRYVTPDELNWVYRSLGLRNALLAGDWASTIQSGHPGVVTTWIGAAAIQMQRWLQPASAAQMEWLAGLRRLSADNVEAFRHLYAFLSAGRLVLALVASLCIVLVYLLARDVLGRRAALLGAFLLALDPFAAGLSGLLHVDGLLATFALPALLGAVHGAKRDGAAGYAALAGFFTALAVLTKTPGLLLLALVPAILAWPMARRLPGELGKTTSAKVGRSLLAWAVALGVTVSVLLPATWAAPGHVIETVSGLTGRLAGDAARPTFFLGRTALEHGPLYYPLVVLFRLSPVTTVGGGLALAMLVQYARGRYDSRAIGPTWLLVFALSFLLAISLAANKFDRYALPALFALILLAGWGIEQVAVARGLRWRHVAGLAIVVQLAFLAAHWPHPLTAYNWLAGGGAVARRVFPVGWGEDAGAAARRLAEVLPDPETRTLFTTSLVGTAPFFPGQIVRLRPAQLTRLQPQDVVLQLPQEGQTSTQVPQGHAPLEEVSVEGVGQALLYSGLSAADWGLPAFSMQAVEFRIGQDLALRGTGSAFLAWPEETVVGLAWERPPQASLSPSYRLQLHLVDDAGEVWVQREVPLLDQADHAPTSWPVAEPQPVYYTLQLPPDLAPGPYQFVARVFNEEGEQLGAFDGAGDFAGVQAPLATVMVTAPAEQPVLEIPQRVQENAYLAGYGMLPEAVDDGAPLTLDLWWRARQATTYTLTLQLAGREVASRLDTQGWRPEQTYHVRPTWRLPAELPRGVHALALQAQDESGQRLWRQPVPLGEVEVTGRERRFELPSDVDPLSVRLGNAITLQHVAAEVQGERLLVHVVWQAVETVEQGYTTFVHVREGEQIVAQVDRPPSPPTESWLLDEVIQEVYRLPRPAQGDYTVVVGLYDAASGERLPAYGVGGARLAGDQYPLEVVVP